MKNKELSISNIILLGIFTAITLFYVGYEFGKDLFGYLN